MDLILSEFVTVTDARPLKRNRARSNSYSSTCRADNPEDCFPRVVGAKALASILHLGTDAGCYGALDAFVSGLPSTQFTQLIDLMHQRRHKDFSSCVGQIVAVECEHYVTAASRRAYVNVSAPRAKASLINALKDFPLPLLQNMLTLSQDCSGSATNLKSSPEFTDLESLFGAGFNSSVDELLTLD